MQRIESKPFGFEESPVRAAAGIENFQARKTIERVVESTFFFVTGLDVVIGKFDPRR